MNYINGRTPGIKKIIGERLTDTKSLQKLDAYLTTLPQTKDIHSYMGRYLPYREQLHDSIIHHFISDARCITRTKPIAILTGGLPGSGKSTFIKANANWLTSPEIFKIDADEVRARLPEYTGWNAYNTHEETSDIVNQLIEIAGGNGCRYDVVFDGTMVNLKKYTNLMNKLIKEGYDVYLIYISVPIETSIQRALQRYKRSGRYVPLNIISQTANKGTSVFEELKNKATGWVLFDSITQTLVGKGGRELPTDRDYTNLTDSAIGRIGRIGRAARWEVSDFL